MALIKKKINVPLAIMPQSKILWKSRINRREQGIKLIKNTSLSSSTLFQPFRIRNNQSILPKFICQINIILQRGIRKIIIKVKEKIKRYAFHKGKYQIKVPSHKKSHRRLITQVV